MANYNAIKYDGFSKGTLVLIKTLTASSSGTLSFVNGSSDVVLDSTYKEYLFIFNSIHAGTDDRGLQVGFRDGSTNYDATITSTSFRAYHQEDGGESSLSYDTGLDKAQQTTFQQLSVDVGDENDNSVSGYMHLFDPSSTTFVKHFMAVTNGQSSSATNQSFNYFTAGYCNVTAAIDAVQFKMRTGNMDAGTIQLFGVS
tara:strand:- start:642 stop:1238 length:597 start_codon:yes stop_codon:yes gene_type:complete